MKVFFDCEFTGLRQDTTLISIGCVADNGQQFYAELTDYDDSQVDAWVRENVVQRLWVNTSVKTVPQTKYIVDKSPIVAVALAAWLQGLATTIEMWGDVLAYDWVLFCNLYGGAQYIPSNVFYIPFDLAITCSIVFFPTLPPPSTPT